MSYYSFDVQDLPIVITPAQEELDRVQRALYITDDINCLSTEEKMELILDGNMPQHDEFLLDDSTLHGIEGTQKLRRSFSWPFARNTFELPEMYSMFAIYGNQIQSERYGHHILFSVYFTWDSTYARLDKMKDLYDNYRILINAVVGRAYCLSVQHQQVIYAHNSALIQGLTISACGSSIEALRKPRPRPFFMTSLLKRVLSA